LSSKLVPVSRRELIRRLGDLGFNGPFTGTDHEFMTKGTVRVKLPNPHHGQDIGADLLVRILRDSGINRDEWFSVA
jgi:predicted RNA binding protein YcfA (HicA-like mRNA interferase family)